VRVKKKKRHLDNIVLWGGKRKRFIKKMVNEKRVAFEVLD